MAEVVAVELDSPQGETVRVEWDAATLTGRGTPGAGEPGWRLEGELDWDEVALLRIVSASLPDGRGLALAALRPAGASGHGEDVVVAALISDGVATAVAKALLSVESDGEGAPLRLGLELDTDPDAMPLRVAAGVTAVSRERDRGLERVHAALDVRLDGKRSVGSYDILCAADGAGR